LGASAVRSLVRLGIEYERKLVMAEDKNASQSVQRQLKLGIVGIGVGASEILPAMEQIPEFKLVAAADINPRVLETFRQRYGAKTYDSVEKMCADPDVEAVWVSTPNKFHAPHTIIAANAGKHVVVEKPMAISLKEAEQMIEASIKNKIKLLCGHTQSFGPHIRTMRQNSRYSEAERAAIRKSLLDGTRDENADKDEMRIGGAQEREVRDRSKVKPWVPNDLGILVATCEKGDLRQSQYGLFVHSDEGTK